MSIKKVVTVLAFCGVSITMLHVSGLVFGLYARGIPIDVPQHILAGMMFAFFWYNLTHGALRTASILVIFFSLVSFAVFMGVLWEFFEFGLAQVHPAIAQDFAMMSPMVGELLRDLLADMVGGSIVALIVLARNKP